MTLTGLEPGVTYSYQAVSTRVVALKAYWPDKGLSVESPVLAFTTLDPRKPATSFSVITDTHEDVARIRALGKIVDWKTTEFLVHLGDAFHWLDTEDQLFRLWLTPTAVLLGGTVPLIYARGNHEMRGPFARQLFDYVPTPEGRSISPATRDRCISWCSTPARTNRTTRTSTRSSTRRRRTGRRSWPGCANTRGRHHGSRRRPSASSRCISRDGAGSRTATQSGSPPPTRPASILVIAGHNHKFSYTAPTDAQRYHLLVVGQDQVARVDATSAELKVVVTAADGKVVHTLTIPCAMTSEVRGRRCRIVWAALQDCRVGSLCRAADQQEHADCDLRRRADLASGEQSARSQASATWTHLVFHGRYQNRGGRVRGRRHRAVHQPRVPAELLQPGHRRRDPDSRREKHPLR